MPRLVDHLEQRLNAWDACLEEAGDQLAGVGVQVLPSEQASSRTARWIEGSLASPLGQSGGQFSAFSGREPTKVPAFVMHRRSSVDAVGGWDASFITSQDSDLSMRLLKSGYRLYRDASVSVHMQKRDTLRNWWKMGHRYGFWRTKVLLKHPGRATWQEFLPLVGLLLTLMLAVVGWTWWAGPLLCYAAVLGLAGIHRTIVGDGWSAMLGVPLCLLMLHTSFTLGLVDGLFGGAPAQRPWLETSANRYISKSLKQGLRNMAESRGDEPKFEPAPAPCHGCVSLLLPPLQQMFELEPRLMYGWYLTALVIGVVVYRRSGVVKDFEYNRAKAMRKSSTCTRQKSKEYGRPMPTLTQP